MPISTAALNRGECSAGPTRLGLSTATALAVAAALPAAVRANDAEALKEVGQSAQESPVLDLLMSHLASQLEKVEGGGTSAPLAATLARIGGNNTNLNNDCNTRVCDPIKFDPQPRPQQYQR